MMRTIITRAALALALLAALPAAAQAPEADAYRFCLNIRDDAREARYAHLEERLGTLRAEIETRRDELTERSDELADWIERREAFLALADERLVAIYGAMRPDTAGEQLALIEPVAAAAVMVRLKPRQASAVMAAMSPERAAALATIIASSRERAGDDG